MSEPQGEWSYVEYCDDRFPPYDPETSWRRREVVPWDDPEIAQ